MRPHLTVIAFLSAVLLSPFTVFAQTYPSRLVRVVVPWPHPSLPVESVKENTTIIDKLQRAYAG